MISDPHTHSNKPLQKVRHDIAFLRKLLLMIINNWYWFIVGLIISGATAYFFNDLSSPTYRVTATVLIEETESGRSLGTENLMQGFGLWPGAQNIDNQMLILSSHTLIRSTLDELPFSTDIYIKKLSKRVSLYPLNPIEIDQYPSGLLPINVEYSIRLVEEGIFRITAESNSRINLDTLIRLNKPVFIEGGYFRIRPTHELSDQLDGRRKMFFKFHDDERLTEQYRNRLTVETASREATIISIGLEGTNKTKDLVFLNKLTEVFLSSNLEKKNHEARRIIEFINDQLVNVSDSLMITENQLQEFRSRNRIMDVSAQAQQIIDQALLLENEKARLTLESNYYQYLTDYLSKENNQEIPISPTTMEIQDPLLGNLMQVLAGLQAEYFGSGVGERNPLQTQLELRINNTKQSLRETLQGIKLANEMALKENETQINTLNAKASRLPMKERQLLGIERKFNLNNVLYTFLLQKRAEAQIQRASNKSDNELVDTARANLRPVAPKKKMIYLLAILIGLGLPLFILLLIEVIYNKLTSEGDIRMITNLPIAGHIPHSRLSYNTVVLNEPQSRIAEAFRSLRTRMEFFTNEEKCPIILVTSTMPGEGKTFTAVNLASAYSLAGKKTLLIGFDLRRPKVSSSFGLNSKVGLSTYLIGKSKSEDIIISTKYPDLHIIPAGPIPPNPGELSISGKVKVLFNVLKKKYDYIIIDSAPIGAVSDSYSIANHVDATIVMVRHGHTNKHFFDGTLAEAQSIGIKGLSILVNDVKTNKGSYRYAYNYNYQSKKK